MKGNSTVVVPDWHRQVKAFKHQARTGRYRCKSLLQEVINSHGGELRNIVTDKLRGYGLLTGN